MNASCVFSCARFEYTNACCENVSSSSICCNRSSFVNAYPAVRSIDSCSRVIVVPADASSTLYVGLSCLLTSLSNPQYGVRLSSFEKLLSSRPPVPFTKMATYSLNAFLSLMSGEMAKTALLAVTKFILVPRRRSQAPNTKSRYGSMSIEQ